jgi:hypothetical protein
MVQRDEVARAAASGVLVRGGGGGGGQVVPSLVGWFCHGVTHSPHMLSSAWRTEISVITATVDTGEGESFFVASPHRGCQRQGYSERYALGGHQPKETRDRIGCRTTG